MNVPTYISFKVRKHLKQQVSQDKLILFGVSLEIYFFKWLAIANSQKKVKKFTRISLHKIPKRSNGWQIKFVKFDALYTLSVLRSQTKSSNILSACDFFMEIRYFTPGCYVSHNIISELLENFKHLIHETRVSWKCAILNTDPRQVKKEVVGDVAGMCLRRIYLNKS